MKNKVGVTKMKDNLAKFYLRIIMRKEGYSEIEIAEALKDGIQK